MTSSKPADHTPAEVVRGFFERMQARDWEGAGRLLAPTIHIEYSETGEHFDGPNFLAMNRAYPDGWTIEVVDVVAQKDQVAAQVRVDHVGHPDAQAESASSTPDEPPTTTFWCAGFYRVADGMILSGIEHWVTEHAAEPPAWRRSYTTATIDSANDSTTDTANR
jgi:hypothetical protein